jgi:membrane protease subunit (stomatin/prohibitin family)
VKDMNKTRTHKAVNFSIVVVVLVAMTICFPIVPGFKTAAQANNGAAFLGGMVAGHVIGGAVRRDRVRTAAAVETANQSHAAQQAAPAQQTPQQRIAQLDKLAAGGYITPEEYKAKKKAILDSM